MEAGDRAIGPCTQESLIAALRQSIHQTVMEEWKKLWRETARGRQLFKVAPEPTRKSLELYRGTPRALSSLVTQIRTGKIGLRHFLH